MCCYPAQGWISIITLNVMYTRILWNSYSINADVLTDNPCSAAVVANIPGKPDTQSGDMALVSHKMLSTTALHLCIKTSSIHSLYFYLNGFKLFVHFAHIMCYTLQGSKRIVLMFCFTHGSNINNFSKND